MDNDKTLDSATVQDLVSALTVKCSAFALVACIPDDGGVYDTKLYDHGNLMCLRGMTDTYRDNLLSRIRKHIKLHKE